MNIVFTNEQEKLEIGVPLMEKMEKVAILALKIAGNIEDYEVSVLLTDDVNIQKLNRDFRNVDSVTDVLSFPMQEEDSDEEPLYFSDCPLVLLGDIAIDVERVKIQSEEFGHSFEREICYLLVHGVLHLLGYDHMSISDKLDMRNMEEKILEQMELKRI